MWKTYADFKFTRFRTTGNSIYAFAQNYSMLQSPRNCMTKIEIFFIKTASPAAGSEYFPRNTPQPPSYAAERLPREGLRRKVSPEDRRTKNLTFRQEFAIFGQSKHDRTWQPFPQAGSTNFSARRAA